jgi:ubiquinone/menaquinone biosynthesis C-methylase UbiE
MQNVDVFDKDASGNAGYLYTHTNRLSCRLATSRTTDIILETGEMQGRSVLDIACGDGFYTIRFWDRGHPKQLVAADAAASAVAVGARNSETRQMRFLVGDAHRMPFADDSFDVVLVQSVLHHDHDPLHMLREAFRLAQRVVIHEPNGNNPGLKVIEKTSRYHIEHNEKSYSSWRMKRWIKEAGGAVVYEKTAGFVPMFCPDWMAKSMKFFEPVVEAVPLLRSIGCAVYVMVGVRR